MAICATCGRVVAVECEPCAKNGPPPRPRDGRNEQQREAETAQVKSDASERAKRIAAKGK